jgi:DNA polymerase-3 subunit gamma/tau
MAKRKSSTPESAVEPDPSQEGYTVLARRYRPQQFADLVGQEAVARALVNALESNRVAHAYLFTGARGVGKTSTARILAKALNCVRGPTPTPCDVCEICHSIAAGEDVDVLEIDGASNRGIDEIREIRQNVQYRPSRSRYKIYIVDEVHMLTQQAFNALLKTLEEPPAHVKFIFATTEVQKIPVTILSRCQRFDFAGIATGMIVERLRQVVAGEGMQADDDALELVARRAEGSMRDSQSLLDQLLAFGGDRLTAAQVHQLLGTATDDRVAALASAVLNHDPKQALELLAQALERGLQLSELLNQLLAYWRDLMVVHCAGAQVRDVSITGKHRETLNQQAAALKLDTILAGLDLLSATKGRMRATSHGRVLVEMALVRLGRLDDLVSLSQLSQLLGKPSAELSAASSAASSSSGAARVAARPAVHAPDGIAGPEGLKKKSLTAPDAAPAEPIPLTPESLEKVWKEVLNQVGVMLKGNLSKSDLPAIFGPNTLVLRFPVAYNSEREHCLRPSNVDKVESALRKITGQQCSLRIESASGSAAKTPEKFPEKGENAQSGYRRQRNEVLKEPLVKRAVEVLGAQVVDIDEGFGAAPSPALDLAERHDNEEA